MRAALILVLLLAGCTAAPPEDRAPDTNAPGPTGPNGANDSQPPTPVVGERMPVAAERFVLLADHSLTVIEPGDVMPAEAKVAEQFRASAFYESLATPLQFTPWQGPPSRSAWESTADIEITLNFMVSAPAVATNPKPAGIPSVGGWFGTDERYAFFLLAQDAPDTLEANKLYTVRLVATPPKGGFFLREGEALALHTFLTYQSADGSAPNYVIGGADPSGFTLVHEHFNVSAPKATVILDEAGELAPNGGVSGDSQQTPVDVAFTVPSEANYVVIELVATPKAGPHVDADVTVQTPSGEKIQGGSSPRERETVVLGPGNLAAYGRDLVAHLTNSGNPGGSTYALKITAYSA